MLDERLKIFERKKLELSCQDHCLLWGSRVIVPPQGREAILRQLHSSHPGVVRMKDNWLVLMYGGQGLMEISRNMYNTVQLVKRIYLPSISSCTTNLLAITTVGTYSCRSGWSISESYISGGGRRSH